jgi:signal transduction histidine kinase
MPSWSVNYLFLANAGLLILLALFLVSRKQSRTTWTFFATNVALALWNICVFPIEEQLLIDHISAIVRFQLIAGMMFANGLYQFVSCYPVNYGGRDKYVYAAIFGVFTLATLTTDYITDAELVNGEVVFIDGPGFLLLSSYISLLCIAALVRSVQTWRKYPEFRSRIRYFFMGIGTYVSCIIIFNLVLPSVGNYDFLIVGRLSTTFAPLFIFYAIVKHEFLDTTVIINKGTAWFVTLSLMLGLGLSLDGLTRDIPALNLVARVAALAGAALFAHPLQQFLLTTAKRKFVRGWYSTEEVINRLAGRITLEKNREAIFKEVVRVLDEVFELEDVLTVIAVRDEQEMFSYYKIIGKFQKIKNTDPLVENVQAITECIRLEDAPAAIAQRLDELQFGKRGRGMILPFHSPEFLEGIVFLGERSNQTAYADSDLRFFNTLISFLSPILYRLTPMEKLEQLYSESMQKLHEAEIQLIRAQKIESIVHATRQCHHEIRTPLNIIKLGIGRVKTLDDLEAYKNVAHEEISHALEIVDETLTITEVDRSSGNRSIDINVNDVVQRCQRLIDRARYSVEMDLAADMPEIPAVFSDIQVVITNLIHNAMEAMPNGGALAFTTRVNAADVVITVEDNGEGIPEQLRSKVWEPYFSGRGSVVGNSNAGRGWGLTIVNRIISAHQGTIRFTSEENVGTRFIITLPRRKTQDETQRAPRLSPAYS